MTTHKDVVGEFEATWAECAECNALKELVIMLFWHYGHLSGFKRQIELMKADTHELAKGHHVTVFDQKVAS